MRHPPPSPAQRPAHSLRAASSGASAVPNGDGTRRNPGRCGVEGDHETGFKPRAVRLLDRAARHAAGAGTRRDRAERDQARARRRIHSGIRPPRGAPVPPRRNARMRAVRARTQERAVPQSVGRGNARAGGAASRRGRRRDERRGRRRSAAAPAKAGRRISNSSCFRSPSAATPMRA